MCWIIRGYFPTVLPSERENRKLGDPAEMARLKATVRELLGFLRRKAPLAADSQPAVGGEGLDTFSIRKTALWGSPRNFGGPHYRARREGPRRVEFPALIRHYAIFKSVPWNFFSLTRFYPAPPAPFPNPISRSPLDARVSGSLYYRKLRNTLERVVFSLYYHDNSPLARTLSPYARR
jgi:hypothetical protein